MQKEKTIKEKIEFIALAALHQCTPEGPDGEPCLKDGFECAKCQRDQTIQTFNEHISQLSVKNSHLDKKGREITIASVSFRQGIEATKEAAMI